MTPLDMVIINHYRQISTALLFYIENSIPDDDNGETTQPARDMYDKSVKKGDNVYLMCLSATLPDFHKYVEKFELERGVLDTEYKIMLSM